MKGREFMRLLKKAGVSFEDAKKHYRLRLGEKSAFMPRHPSQEIKTGIVKGILKQLELKMDDILGDKRRNEKDNEVEGGDKE